MFNKKKINELESRINNLEAQMRVRVTDVFGEELKEKIGLLCDALGVKKETHPLYPLQPRDTILGGSFVPKPKPFVSESITTNFSSGEEYKNTLSIEKLNSLCEALNIEWQNSEVEVNPGHFKKIKGKK